MSDLFHQDIPDAVIDKVFAVMALAPQHTFQCLTKRASRMRTYCTEAGVTHRIAQAMDAIRVDQEHDAVEQWAQVPGWETYEASTHGHVRRAGQPIRPSLNPRYDRPSVTLWRGNESTTIYVHTLVLLAHRGPAPEGTEARHRNGNRQDNRLANLEWATGSVNQQDKVRHGSNGGPAKLTRAQAADIRALRSLGRSQQSIADEFGVSRSLVSMIESRSVWPDALEWPLPNVWLGISAEDQARADERIPELLQTPAAVRFISAEPLLGPIDLTDIPWPAERPTFPETDDLSEARSALHFVGGARLDWIIVGGESGPNARPMHPDWARQLRDQCAAAGVAFFFKQWGAWGPINIDDLASEQIESDELEDRLHDFGDEAVSRIGKKRAGRLLDGIEHNEFPNG